MGGRSNVGKSTLLNRLVGHKVAIVSPKPQTTRRRLLGIRNDPDAQVIFIDTPGIHESPRLINRRMAETARRGLAEGDIVMGVVEAGPKLAAPDRAFLDEISGARQPKVLVINKIDLIGRARLLPMLEQCREALGEAEIVPVSALTGENVEELIRTLKPMLPEGPSLMPEDEYTDQTERMMAEEIIREKLFLTVHQEIPFSTSVKVERFVEEPGGKLISVGAIIVVERESHKAIVIGAGGRTIKEIGTAARLELEEVVASHVFLELHVKVDPNWTRSPNKLQEMGL